MKNCVCCGREISEQASWCPYCEKEQKEPQVIHAPAGHRKTKIFVLCAAVAVLLLGMYSYATGRRHEPKVYEGGPQVDYMIDGKECRVFLCFTNSYVAKGISEEAREDKLPPGETAAFPSLLSAWSDGDPDINTLFADQVASVKVTSLAEADSEKVTIYGPDPGAEREFGAAWVCDVVYNSGTGTNRICWEISMKNGDVIRLYQSVTGLPLPTIEYHYKDTPMETVEEISALIERTAAEDPDAVLTLYLPPVTYTGQLVMDKRTAILFGSEEDGRKTTFTDTVQILTREPHPVKIIDVDFTGERGTGIICQEALYLKASLVTGWDVGVDVQEGGWASIQNAAFVGNGTGLLFDSQESSFTNPNYENLVFAENKLGLDIRNVPGDIQLKLINPVFDTNVEDFSDPKGLLKTEPVSEAE